MPESRKESLGRGALILTVTRACNLRCSYCPTAKDGWPALSVADALRAVRLFVDRFGGGDIKLFGGEPLLEPEVVRAVLEAVRQDAGVRRVYVSTNGLGLNADWLAYLRSYPKAVLTLSMDGTEDDHERMRRPLKGVRSSYQHILSLLPELHETPRVVVTQTIAPATAGNAASNFRHLRGLGFWRFNLLPGYYVPWRSGQLDALASGFEEIEHTFRSSWARGERLYLRNLFTRAPTPFFNAGLVVDADRRIHPTNIGMSGVLDSSLDRTACGTLDDPPTPAELAMKARATNQLLETLLAPRVWDSTLAVDRMLTDLCERLFPDYLSFRQARRVVDA